MLCATWLCRDAPAMALMPVGAHPPPCLPRRPLPGAPPLSAAPYAPFSDGSDCCCLVRRRHGTWHELVRRDCLLLCLHTIFIGSHHQCTTDKPESIPPTVSRSVFQSITAMDTAAAAAATTAALAGSAIYTKFSSSIHDVVQQVLVLSIIFKKIPV